MKPSSAEIVICGAGIAGISTAYHLAVKEGVQDVILIDERPPLSLTSDKSTECYRNWWPGPGNAMVSMTNRSIDILEDLALESGNIFHMNRRGYLFASANPQRLNDFKNHAEEAAALGAGPVRYHTGHSDEPEYHPAPESGYEDQPVGSDLITDTDLIQKHFPYLSEETIAVVHARRCGFFSAQQLGMYMLDRARERGVRVLESRVESVEVINGKVAGVRLASGEVPEKITASNFVNAAGPFLKMVGEMVGADLPVFSELHAKISIKDSLGVFPRDAGLLIWSDPQFLPWTKDERSLINREGDLDYMLREFPHGVHARPDGPPESPIVLLLWTYDVDPVEPEFPLKFDPHYPEIVLRGLATMIPEMKKYFGKMPKPYVDGGYYTKTQENRPLIGPLPVQGSWVIGALSGFGLMSAPACGELLAAHIIGKELPDYAPWFLLERYQEPAYQDLLLEWSDTGQI
ncbi:MAG: FAD-binding oxidoreductase [Anaerolineaceae bacterium]|nr:MAG: FAD-binding oxidoreductase [Anaerolineaceae bacterium]